jgi:hypothetical protein
MRIAEQRRLDEVYCLMYYAGFSLMEALSLTDEQRAVYVKRIGEKAKQ